MKRNLSILFTGVFTVLSVGVLCAQDGAAPASTSPAVMEGTASTTQGATSLVTLPEVAVGTGVMDRALQGKAETFSAAVSPSVYTFNKVVTDAVPTTIRHVYSKDGVERGTVTLNIGGSPWRTWSNHMVEPGNWKVDVLDADGNLAGSVSFTVTE